jgi:hypothetical protein
VVRLLLDRGCGKASDGTDASARLHFAKPALLNLNIRNKTFVIVAAVDFLLS